MKVRRLFSLLISICLFFLLSGMAFAQAKFPGSKKTKNIVVKKDEVIDRDFFAAGETVTISGIVNGDVYAAGANVMVDGKINGDLLVGAGTVTILGEVSDDVRVGGGNILINGIIGKNLTVGGGNVTVTKEAKIGGSLLAFCGNIDVNGPIGREANVFAGRALFGNQVGGDLKGKIEELVLTSKAEILGDLEYESPEKAEMAEGATVSGQISYEPPEEKVSKLEKFAPFKTMRPVARGVSKIRLFFKLFSFITSFVLGFIFISLFPKRAKGIVKVLESRLWTSLGVGILTPIVFVLAMMLLAITLIGIPLVFLLAPIFAFLVYFSKIFAALCTGRKVLLSLNWGESQTWALFSGLLIYSLLRLIPVISPLTFFAFTAFGLGAFVLDQKSRLSKKH